MSIDDNYLVDNKMGRYLKTVQKIALICILLMFSSLALAESGLITGYQNGYVDWGSHTIRVKGIGEYNPNLTPSQFRLSGAKKARENAEYNLLSILVSLKYNCEKSVRDLMLTSIESANRIEEMVKVYRIVDKTRLMPDSSVEIEIEFTFTRELIDELIKASGENHNIQYKRNLPEIQTDPSTDTIYFDCRGMKIEPSLAPLVVNDDGDVLFSIGTVNFAACKECMFVKYISQARTQNHGGTISSENHEFITATEIKKCNIIIDDIDYENLISSEVHRKALKNGRVIILVD